MNQATKKQKISFSIYREDWAKLIAYIAYIDNCSKEHKPVPKLVLSKIKKLFEKPLHDNKLKIESQKNIALEIIKKIDLDFETTIKEESLVFQLPHKILKPKTNNTSQKFYEKRRTLRGFVDSFFAALFAKDEKEFIRITDPQNKKEFAEYAHKELKRYLKDVSLDQVIKYRRTALVGALAASFDMVLSKEQYKSIKYSTKSYSEYLASQTEHYFDKVMGVHTKKK